MIKKILIYLSSGGLRELLLYAVNSIKSKVYYRSETVFLYLERNNFNDVDHSRTVFFKKLSDDDCLQNISFPRMSTLGYDKWFLCGSSVVIGFIDSSPVSFTWLHIHQYNVPSIGLIPLKENQCWIGPTFVHKAARRQGINIKQIAFQIRTAPENITAYVTSANSNNSASISSFKRLGFVEATRVISTQGFFSNARNNKILHQYKSPPFNIIPPKV